MNVQADHWSDADIAGRWVWRRFSLQKMACSHCGRIEMNGEFMDRLTALREEYGQPMMETSGYRCPDHPVERKKKRAGAHTLGQAIDIAIYGESLYDLLPLIKKHGFTGIGIRQSGHMRRRFLHLDDLGVGWPRPTIWTY